MLDPCGSGVGFPGLTGLRGSCGRHGAVVEVVRGYVLACNHTSQGYKGTESLLFYSSPAIKKAPLIKVAISEQTFAHSTVLDSSLSFHKFDFYFIACSSSKKSHVVNDRLPRHR